MSAIRVICRGASRARPGTACTVVALAARLHSARSRQRQWCVCVCVCVLAMESKSMHTCVREGESKGCCCCLFLTTHPFTAPSPIMHDMWNTMEHSRLDTAAAAAACTAANACRLESCAAPIGPRHQCGDRMGFCIVIRRLSLDPELAFL